MATMEKLDHDKVKLTISVDADSFAAAVQQAYLKNRQHYKVQGFRAGKAPRKIIETLYGEDVFYADAFEFCWGDAYDEAIEEFDLEPVDQPKISIESMSLKDGMTYTAEVQLKPEVTLGEYKGMEIEKPDYSVKDEEVDAKINEEREKNARFLDVDRAAENGDRVLIDYSGSVDGEKFEGGTAEGQTLVLGSNTFIPGFEDQIVGMKQGEERDIQVKFPDDYQAEELAGKDAVFAVKLHSVQVKELPELDDEFAKDVSDFDTLAEYKADIRKTMTEQAEKNEKTAIENIAIKKACENASVEIPECMIDRQIDWMVDDFRYRLQMSGIPFEEYLKYTGATPEMLREQFLPESEARVKMQLVMAKIVKEEGIECTDEDLEEIIEQYAKDNNMTAEQLKSSLKDDDLDYLRDRKKTEKAINLVVENLKFKKAAKAAAKKKAAPKKTAAKKEEAKAEEKPETAE